MSIDAERIAQCQFVLGQIVVDDRYQADLMIGTGRIPGPADPRTAASSDAI